LKFALNFTSYSLIALNLLNNHYVLAQPSLQSIPMPNHQPTKSDRPNPNASPSRFLSLGATAGLAALVLLAGGGAAWWTWQSSNSTNLTTPTESDTTQTGTSPAIDSESPANTPSTEQTVQIYWIKILETGIEPVPVSTTVTGEQPEAILSAAFEEMLKGTPDSDLTSTIPPNTKLNNLSIQENGIHLDLSQEFTTGGGSTSMIGRLAQVVYTATTLDPDSAVWISIEGNPLEVLGGEGIIIDQPTTRRNFEENFPQ
jgi:spore germination protein GerM